MRARYVSDKPSASGTRGRGGPISYQHDSSPASWQLRAFAASGRCLPGRPHRRARPLATSIDDWRVPRQPRLVATPDDVLSGVLRAEIEVAARIMNRDAASLTTPEAVRALREYGLRCSQSTPLVEAQISIPEPELQHILSELCERYGAGLHKKPRQRLLTITAPRAFIDNALQPVLQGMLDVVIASRHEQTRRLIAELRASAPADTMPPS